jgi:hypothetical protein
LSQCSNAAAAAPFEGMKVKYVILIYFDWFYIINVHNFNKIFNIYLVGVGLEELGESVQGDIITVEVSRLKNMKKSHLHEIELLAKALS